ncbi:hypothetical protein LX64_02034 [Chitinophaga skermanii]|uniref:Uncharacterized protein n=1 Tax=Chitinophaga skermanii TaxID=331697 RepID=A0A327QQN8_9BACT|nr:hypothetical protein [Chitinophaga skermanii]RAJ06906.1 hypothetical protein LX64_02034 [Chitinophaga skermanii]
MYKFRIIHPNAITRLRLQPVMHGMAGILFMFNTMGAYRVENPNLFLVIFFLLMGLASMVFPFMLRRLKNIPSANGFMRIMQVVILLGSALYFLGHLQPTIAILQIFAGLTLAYAAYAEYKIFQPAYVELSNTNIVLPTLFAKRTIGWNELKNVILRNDVFTIDFKNNKLLQLDVADEIGIVEQEEINAFCSSRLTK